MKLQLNLPFAHGVVPRYYQGEMSMWTVITEELPFVVEINFHNVNFRVLAQTGVVFL